MEQIINISQPLDKAIKKYILEVDDAIEAHGFKAASCIDYAEDTILEMENSIKKQYLEGNSSSLLFTNLENSLNETVNNIVNYTKEDTISRNTNFPNEKLDEKLNNLHSSLVTLNSRFYNSLGIL